MSTITIASLFRWMCWWFRFLWQTKFIFTIHKKRLLYSPWKPFSNWFTSRFHWMRLKRKENSLKTIYLFFWITFVDESCLDAKLSLFRNFDLIPFRFLYDRTWCLTYHLGSTHPYSITVFMEPFSTSVFKFYTHTEILTLCVSLTWIFATTTKICTNHNFI